MNLSQDARLWRWRLKVFCALCAIFYSTRSSFALTAETFPVSIAAHQKTKEKAERIKALIFNSLLCNVIYPAQSFIIDISHATHSWTFKSHLLLSKTSTAHRQFAEMRRDFSFSLLQYLMRIMKSFRERSASSALPFILFKLVSAAANVTRSKKRVNKHELISIRENSACADSLMQFRNVYENFLFRKP